MTNAFLPSLPPDAGLAEVLKAYRVIGEPIVRLAEAVMRKDSELDPGERELIAAYVSSLNACRYCVDSHSMVAGQFGIDPRVLTQLNDSIDDAEVRDPLKPVLHYVKKLTLTPSRMTIEDVDRIYAAGWSEETLIDAVSVCAFFNCMNRIADGTGRVSGGTEVETVQSPEGQTNLALTYLAWGRAKGILSD